jgi:pimeloyl-[acyl-carrier protein] methyl ester esterase
LTADELNQLLGELKQLGAELVYWASESEHEASQQAALALNGFLADRKLTYLMRLASDFKPKQLTLIAAPYQFVSDERFKSGMDPLTFQLFRESYAKDPARTKQRFHALVAKGDEAPKTILSQLEHHADVDNTGRWLPWLDNLHAVSLRDINLSAVPQTLIIQGAADAVVPQAQGEALLSALPKAKLELWDNTGHAPHLRDKLRLLQSLNHFA